jgi:type I restriction enzyme S subunit
MMIPAKRVARFINGNAFKPSDWGDGGLPIVRIAQLSGGEFDNYYDGQFDDRYRITDGDLLLAWSATIDSYLWRRGPAILNQHIFKVLPGKGVSKRFLFYSLKHYSTTWADIDAHGSTTKHIKRESLGNKLFLPPSICRNA